MPNQALGCVTKMRVIIMNFGSVALEQTALINSYCYFSFIANLYLLESQYTETLSLLDYHLIGTIP